MSIENGSIDNGTADADESETDNQLATEHAILDDENYTHSRRQKLIEDKREHAIDVRTDARGQHIAGEISESEALQYYRGALESYVLQIIPVLKREDIEFEENYLTDVKLGELRFEPPAELVEFAEENIQRLVPGSSIPRSKTIPICGLKSITDLPSPLSKTFSVSVRKRGDIQSPSRTVEQELPWSVLDTAMETADRALEDAQLGIKVGEQEKQTKITWELIKEVDQWRQNNIN